MQKTKEHIVFKTVKILSVGLIIWAVFNTNWLLAYNAGLTLIVAFFPQILQKKWNVSYPGAIDVSILLFVVCALIFGEAFNFYYKFAWWDVALHTFSGVIIALVAFIIIKQLNDIDMRVSLSPIFVALFALSFAMLFGSVWEIFEYMSDQLFNTNMQKNGLDDTMQDLIVSLVGATTVSIFGYFYVKYGTKNFVGKMVEEGLNKG